MILFYEVIALHLEIYSGSQGMPFNTRISSFGTQDWPYGINFLLYFPAYHKAHRTHSSVAKGRPHCLLSHTQGWCPS